MLMRALITPSLIKNIYLRMIRRIKTNVLDRWVLKIKRSILLTQLLVVKRERRATFLLLGCRCQEQRWTSAGSYGLLLWIRAAEEMKQVFRRSVQSVWRQTITTDKKVLWLVMMMLDGAGRDETALHNEPHSLANLASGDLQWALALSLSLSIYLSLTPPPLTISGSDKSVLGCPYTLLIIIIFICKFVYFLFWKVVIIFIMIIIYHILLV